MRLIQNLCYGDEAVPEHRLDLYLPDGAPVQTLVWFHGGGMESGDKELGPMPEYLAENGVAVASANYRMYKSARYPQFIQDAARAVQFVRERIGAYGGTKKLLVGGSSAGAYLAMMLCFDAGYLAPYHFSPDDIDGYIFNAGQPTTHYQVLVERGLDARRVVADEASPLYHVGERDIAALSPLYFLLAENDMPNRREQTELMLSTLRRFGVNEEKLWFTTVPGAKHCGYNREMTDAGKSVLGELLLPFIRSC